MPSKKKGTPGQKLWWTLYRAHLYDREGGKIDLPLAPACRFHLEGSTKRWLQGMARHLKERVCEGLRMHREELGLTQQELADMAGLSFADLAMIEGGESLSDLDTAARLCWALDLAAGITREQMA
jgi:DNA-binding XRE family transcriptional regulator